MANETQFKVGDRVTLTRADNLHYSDWDTTQTDFDNQYVYTISKIEEDHYEISGGRDSDELEWMVKSDEIKLSSKAPKSSKKPKPWRLRAKTL